MKKRLKMFTTKQDIYIPIYKKTVALNLNPEINFYFKGN